MRCCMRPDADAVYAFDRVYHRFDKYDSGLRPIFGSDSVYFHSADHQSAQSAGVYDFYSCITAGGRQYSGAVYFGGFDGPAGFMGYVCHYFRRRHGGSSGHVPGRAFIFRYLCAGPRSCGGAAEGEKTYDSVKKTLKTMPFFNGGKYPNGLLFSSTFII